jgi:hypothetical protein
MLQRRQSRKIQRLTSAGIDPRDFNMMTRNRVFSYVTAEPFCPFRIKMTGGDSFEIRHPEMIQVGRTTATIFTWMSEGQESPWEREREISIILIESIERLTSAVSQDQSHN